MQKSNIKNDQWAKIFEELDLSTIPIKYISSIRIIFSDKKIWDIDIKKSKEMHSNNDTIESSLLKLFDEHHADIKNIDFRLDTKKIKRDVKKKTNSILGNKK